MAKRLNPNLVKIHRSYSVEEVSSLFSIHKNTVRTWIKKGLPTSDDKRPVLILGSELKQYLQEKRELHKRPCKLFEIYCLKCRVPQVPADGIVDYEPLNRESGRLIGLCPCCNNIINKYFKHDRLYLLRDRLDITLPKALKHLNKSANTLLNSDFN